MNLQELAQAVKEEARRQGFLLAGIASPQPSIHLEAYENWLKAGYHAQMAYLAEERARERRANPLSILPECQSILVLGLPYFPPHRSPTPPPGHGRVAAYAWGDDYHLTIPPRLQALVTFLEEKTGHSIPNRWYTDTGPLLERDLAQQAGLGWAGKNTCLISPRHGSYFLLAEILLGLPLPPDAPFASDHCGSCARCLQACPTGALLPGKILDARRCLSYLTIESREEIPAEHRPALGSWVFGCDICQMVCPWNLRFAPLQGDPAFAPRPGLPFPVLAEDLALTPDGFAQKFKNSPLKRAKLSGYLRNLRAAQENT